MFAGTSERRHGSLHQHDTVAAAPAPLTVNRMTTAPRIARLFAALVTTLGLTFASFTPATAANPASEGLIFFSCRNAQNTEIASIKLVSGYPTTSGRYDLITYPRITVTTPGSRTKVSGTVAMHIDSLRAHSKKSFVVTPGVESRLNWKVKLLTSYSPAASIYATIMVGKTKTTCQVS